MLKFLRRNTIAFLALFIALSGTAYAANTVRSTDIVDGQVKNDDLATNSVGTLKIKANSVTGSKIDESTLGRVPDSGRVAGLPVGYLRQRTRTVAVPSSSCAVADTYVACAPISVTVPSGHFYVVTVTSHITATPLAGTSTVVYCPATAGPSCMSGVSQNYVTLWAGGYSSGSLAASWLWTPGWCRCVRPRRPPDGLSVSGGSDGSRSSSGPG